MMITAKNIGKLSEEAQNDLLDSIFEGLRHDAQLNGIDATLEFLLNALDAADEDDTFGTEGWRHAFGLAD